MRHWPYLLSAIVLEVAATLSLRASFGHVLWIAVVGIGYAGAFACLAVMMRLGALIGVVYAIWAASGVTLTALLAAALFGDPLTVVMSLGIAVVIAGILIVESGSRAAGRPAPREPSA